MTRHGKSVFVGVFGALCLSLSARNGHAQVLTAIAPGLKPDTTTVHSHSDLTNGQENTLNIPNNRDFILTDVIATCRTLNACALEVFGPTHNQGSALVMFLVAPNSTVSHSFTTGLRVEGGNGAQVFIRNFVQPGPNALLYVTISGYFVKK